MHHARADDDLPQPRFGDAEERRGALGEIHDAVSGIGSAVVDENIDRAAVLQVRDPRPRRQRQNEACGGQLPLIEDHAAGGLAAAPMPAIPGRRACLLDNTIWPFLQSGDLLVAARRGVLIDPRVRLGLHCGRNQQCGGQRRPY